MSDKLPDALMLKTTIKVGNRMVQRVASVASVAEPLLGVDRSKGERAYIRIQTKPKNRLFITKSVHDTIYFPKWHDRQNEDRYEWVRQEDGSDYGYLVEGATPGGELNPDDDL